MKSKLIGDYTLKELIEHEEFRNKLEKTDIDNIKQNGIFKNKKRAIDDLSNYFDIDVKGYGKKTIISVKNIIADDLTGSKYWKRVPTILKGLIKNLEIMNANNELESLQAMPNKKWLDKIGDILLYDNTYEMKRRVKAKFLNKKDKDKYSDEIPTKYDNKTTYLIGYKSPLNDLNQIMLCEGVLDAMNAQIDNMYTYIGEKLRDKTFVLGYKWESKYLGETFENTTFSVNMTTFEQEEVVHPSKVVPLTDEQIEIYNNFIDDKKKEYGEKKFDVREFSRTKECKKFISNRFNMRHIWIAWDLVNKPASNGIYLNKKKKNLKNEFIDYTIIRFSNATFGQYNQNTPHKYLRAEQISKLAHKYKDMESLLEIGLLTAIKEEKENNYCTPESIREDYIHKLYRDEADVIVFKNIIETLYNRKKVDVSYWIERVQEYETYWDNLVTNDELLSLAVEAVKLENKQYETV